MSSDKDDSDLDVGVECEYTNEAHEASDEHHDENMTQNEQFDSELLKKLDVIKEIKTKTMNLQNVKTMLFTEMNSIDEENKCIEKYRSELNTLLKEKQALVDELRQVETDICDMETILKRFEEERQRSNEKVIRLKGEFRPLKENIDTLRDSIGLGKLDLELPNEYKPRTSSSPEMERPSKIRAVEASNDDETSNESKSPDRNNNHNRAENQEANQENRTVPFLLQNPAFRMFGDAAAFADLRNSVNDAVPPFAFSAAALVAQQLQTNKLFNAALTSHHLNAQHQHQQQHQAQLQPTFTRQQPPPMKVCTSCNQQIHRNAPICPLCKAKSRSRNPKRPRKKNDTEECA